LMRSGSPRTRSGCPRVTPAPTLNDGKFARSRRAIADLGVTSNVSGMQNWKQQGNGALNEGATTRHVLLSCSFNQALRTRVLRAFRPCIILSVSSLRFQPGA
jgi:hypothetical protein